MEKYRILILGRYLFIENFVYAEIVNGILDEKYQEKLIFDKLLTTLRWGTTFAESGFLVNSTSCDDKLKSTTPTATFINDKIVSFTRITENVNEDIFPIETIKTYINAEHLPNTRLTCSTSCGKNCEVYVYLKVVEILNTLYNCQCNTYDSEYCVYSIYDTQKC